MAEVYNSDLYAYLELELHRPTVTLSPGERFSLEERQAVTDLDRWPRTESAARAIAIATQD